MFVAVALIEAEREAEREAEHAKTERQRKLTALDRQLDTALDGRSGLLLLSAAAEFEERECALLCDEQQRHVGSMRCCSARVCAECLGGWLRRHGEEIEVGYTDGISREDGREPSHTTGWARPNPGRMLTVRLNTHRCPFCREKCESVRRAWAK